ncbi:MAG: hypothetical protein HGA31_00185 [Candidatus Moranbacteria bacterium]|nr:hypothetical protein [Candidatus Moranbacteria bacterium]
MVSETEFEILSERIGSATGPEDIFGMLTGVGDKLTEVKRLYRNLSKTVHPDRNSRRKSDADGAFKRLSELFEKAKVRIEAGVYGSTVPDETAEESFSIRVGDREYKISSRLAQGDLSTVYYGIDAMTERKIVLKLVDDPADNDLMQNEIRTLRRLKENPGAQDKHLPMMIDRFKAEDGRQALILEMLDGYYDLVAIRESDRYRNGIPEQHVAWMLTRLLSVVGYVHSRGVIHGNIEPAHVMIRPRDHNLSLVDWSYAIGGQKAGERFKVLNEDYSPSEVAEGKPPLPSSDLYAVGKSMIYALGGNVKTNRMPHGTTPGFARFLEFLVRESPIQRAQDAWEMHKMLQDLRVELWGPIRFLEFVLP